MLPTARLVSFSFSIKLSWNWYFQIFADTCIILNIDIPLIDRTADLSHNNDDILWHESSLIHFVGLCIWCYVGPVCAELGNVFSTLLFVFFMYDAVYISVPKNPDFQSGLIGESSKNRSDPFGYYTWKIPVENFQVRSVSRKNTFLVDFLIRPVKK